MRFDGPVSLETIGVPKIALVGGTNKGLRAHWADLPPNAFSIEQGNISDRKRLGSKAALVQMQDSHHHTMPPITRLVRHEAQDFLQTLVLLRLFSKRW